MDLNTSLHLSSIIPTCSIDNTLLSQFDQSNSIFANKREVCQTPETMGKETFRRLRNYTTTTEEKVGHPLKIGKVLHSQATLYLHFAN